MCLARQTEAMARAAGELRKENILYTASAPWEATKLRSALPLVPAQNITLEEAEQHVNVLAVRASQSSSPLAPPLVSFLFHPLVYFHFIHPCTHHLLPLDAAPQGDHLRCNCPVECIETARCSVCKQRYSYAAMMCSCAMLSSLAV